MMKINWDNCCLKHMPIIPIWIRRYKISLEIKEILWSFGIMHRLKVFLRRESAKNCSKRTSMFSRRRKKWDCNRLRGRKVSLLYHPQGIFLMISIGGSTKNLRLKAFKPSDTIIHSSSSHSLVTRSRITSKRLVFPSQAASSGKTYWRWT